jgi:hypothetical protein
MTSNFISSLERLGHEQMIVLGILEIPHRLFANMFLVLPSEVWRIRLYVSFRFFNDFNINQTYFRCHSGREKSCSLFSGRQFFTLRI